MAIAPQAGLQRRLLLHLREEPAASVSDLARRVNATRPSVSRALAPLLKRGLVERQGRRLSITEAGSQTVKGYLLSSVVRRRAGTLASMPLTYAQLDKAFDVSRIAEAALRAPAFRALEASKAWQAGLAGRALPVEVLGRSLLTAEGIRTNEHALEAIDELSRRAVTGMRIADVYPSIAAMVSESLARITEKMEARLVGSDVIGAALASVVRASELQLEVISAGTAMKGWWTPAVADLLPTTSRMLSDLAAMEAGMASRAARKLAEPLTSAAARVAAASADHFSATMGQLLTVAPLPADRRMDVIVVPASGSASFVHGARRVLEPDADEGSPDPGPTTADVAELLRRIDPVLADALLGAWDRIESGGPDWARSAAHQGREALNLTLERLSAGVPVDPQLGRPTRKARVRFVLGGDSLAVWAEAQADAVESTYAILTSEAHARIQRRLGRAGMAALIRSVEALLLMLLTAQERMDRLDA